MSSGSKTFRGSQGEGHSLGNVVEFVLSGGKWYFPGSYQCNYAAYFGSITVYKHSLWEEVLFVSSIVYPENCL